MTTKELVVLINDQMVGLVVQGSSGRFSFRYADAWLSTHSAIPLSLSMPLAKPEHGDNAVTRGFIWHET